MVNNTQNSKLDDTVKQTLSNYEAPFDAADWEKMENILNASPKSTTINFNWLYILYAVIGVAVLIGGYSLYNSVKHSKSTENTVVTAPVQINNSPAPVKTTTVTPLKPTPPPTTSTPITTATEKTTVPAAPENTIKAPDTHLSVAADNNSKKETTTAEKTKTKNKKDTPQTVGEEFNANQHVLGMGNEPIFGDMLDSSKGIVNETKEKEETKKAAKIKNNSNIGWNVLLPNVNPDSIRSHHEKMQKDSLKNN